MSGEAAAAETKKGAEKASEKPATEKKNGKKTAESPASITTVESREAGKKVEEVTKTEPAEILKVETDDSGSFIEFHIEMTLNIGNMEFAKVHVGRRAPHKATEADANAAMKIIKGWVRNEFREEVKSIREKVAAAKAKKAESRSRPAPSRRGED